MHRRFGSAAVTMSLAQAVVTFLDRGPPQFPAHGQGGACYIALRFFKVFGVSHVLLRFSGSKGKELVCWSHMLWSANPEVIQISPCTQSRCISKPLDTLCFLP